MIGKRIVYQNWIVDLGRDPDARNLNPETAPGIRDEKRVEQIHQAVSTAMAELDEDDREFIIHFHFMGESYRQISDKSGWPVHKLEALHKRSLRKLRKLLAPFVDEAFGIETEQNRNCPICDSVYSKQMNEIIRNRDRKSTWKPVLNLFRTKYNLFISSPQLLVGHEKYH
jgi:hypothetical protein